MGDRERETQQQMTGPLALFRAEAVVTMFQLAADDIYHAGAADAFSHTMYRR
jgi:hypothetical protein